MDKKNDFFLGAPLPLWGCVSIWLGNLVRLTLESAVPYAWAALSSDTMAEVVMPSSAIRNTSLNTFG